MDKKRQTFETAIKATLNLIPGIGGIGGALASILGDYMSERKETRFHKFIKDSFDEINMKQAYIIKEYVSSNDFLDIFENILSDVMNTRIEMKRNMLKNLLVNSCTIQGTTYERTEDFQHLIDVLSPISLLILSVFYDLRDIYMDGETNSIKKYWNKIQEVTRIDDETTLLDYIGELESRCLIESFRNNTYSDKSGAPLIGNRPFITEKGLLFYNYIIIQDSCNLNFITQYNIPKVQIKYNEFENKVATKEDINTVLNTLNNIPKIRNGTTLPTDLKDGEIFIQIE